MKKRTATLLSLLLLASGCGTVKKTQESRRERTETVRNTTVRADSSKSRCEIQKDIAAGEESYTRRTEIRFDPERTDSTGFPVITGIVLTETERKSHRNDRTEISMSGEETEQETILAERQTEERTEGNATEERDRARLFGSLWSIVPAAAVLGLLALLLKFRAK